MRLLEIYRLKLQILKTEVAKKQNHEHFNNISLSSSIFLCLQLLQFTVHINDSNTKANEPIS